MASFSAFEKFSMRYSRPILAYGLIRKSWQMSDAKMYDYRNNKPKDMYYTTKVGIVALSTIATLTLWPYALMKDIYKIEGYIRGDEEEKKHMSIEYLFDF